nr:SDR family NAD(P)-dependent oxidoreductase [Microbacterium immunditiarum]
MSGARALVTGSTSGVGLEIARVLAAHGAPIVLPARSKAKGESAIAALRQTAPAARLELRDLDLVSLASVRAFADRLDAEGRPLDLLVINAGVAMVGDRTRRVTADGFELHFQTNFLGHALLVLSLLPLLRASRTRIAVQGSIVSALYGVSWDDPQFARRYSALRAYASSKTALSLFALELARRVPEVRVDLCHPGVVPATAIAPQIRAHFAPSFRDFAVGRLWNPPAQAAETAVLALTTDAPSPTFCAPGGRLQFSGRARLRTPFRRLDDPEGSRRIWELAEKLAVTA